MLQLASQVLLAPPSGLDCAIGYAPATSAAQLRPSGVTDPPGCRTPWAMPNAGRWGYYAACDRFNGNLGPRGGFLASASQASSLSGLPNRTTDLVAIGLSGESIVDTQAEP